MTPTVAGPRRHAMVLIVVAARRLSMAGKRDLEHQTGVSVIVGARRPATAPTNGDSPINAVTGMKPPVTDPGVHARSNARGSTGQIGMAHVRGVFGVHRITPLPVPTVINFGMIPSSMIGALAIRMAGYFGRYLSRITHARLRTIRTPRLTSVTTYRADLGVATKTRALHSVTIPMMDGRAPRRSCAKYLSYQVPKATPCNHGNNG